MKLLFRKATENDVLKIWEIILYAKELRKGQGSEQWQDGYPNEQTIKNDIAKNYGYVVENQGDILGYFALIFEEEPAYTAIEGKWLSEQNYAVVHRVAVSPKAKGLKLGTQILQKVEELCIENQVFNIRVDTNFDNVAMLSIFEKLGYKYCGEVYFRGSSRKAFEKLLPI